jgi:Tol biopolymer transport system component/predicted Ser/Thr protein kinase
MGEVYRARDTRLDRTVAIKILRTDVSVSDDRRRRFEREARTISSMNHPHICALYDIGHDDGVDFLVMQYLEGETLAERLKRGALPFKEALRVAIDITEALESAHRQGIVHRDLKPANVMLTKFGAMLMDFGLARLRSDSAAIHIGDPAATLAKSADPLTGDGRIIGTMRYMAPEQIEGQEADARTDIFAAGLLLYEMVTGRNAFEGKTSPEIIASTLKSEPPPLSHVESDPSGSLDRTIRHCIAKKPEDRWQSAHDLALALKWISESAPAKASVRGDTPLLRRAWVGWTAAALFGIAALGLAFVPNLFRRGPEAKQVVRFSIFAPEGATVEGPFWSYPAISPDGRMVAFIAFTGARSELWLRPLDALEARALPETEGALAPFWAPDSRWIGFFAEGHLKKIPAAGGSPQPICDVGGLVTCGGWSRKDTILFTLDESQEEVGLYQVSAAGGPATKVQLRAEDNKEIRWSAFPHFLPDGNRFLLVDFTVQDSLRLILGTMESPSEASARSLGPLLSRVEYDPSGYILAVRENTLVAQRFDVSSASFQGEPIPFIENVANFAGAAARFSISRNGVLLYQSKLGALSQLEWFDRTGRPLGTLGGPSQYMDLEISPDEQRLAVSIAEPSTGAGDIWIFPLPEGNPTRLTSDPSDDFAPIWSSDGRELAFSSSREGTPSLYRMRLGESEIKVLVPNNNHLQTAYDWLSDQLVYGDRDPHTATDIWRIAFEQDAKPAPLVRSRFREAQGTVSPNGRWITYASNESGRFEVYIQPFSSSGSAGEKRRISSQGGLTPKWRGDGKEIFYLDLSDAPALMAAALDPLSGKAAGPTRTLFQLRTQVQAYDVTDDGERFLINHSTSAGETPAMNIVVNWPEEVRKAQAAQ